MKLLNFDSDSLPSMSWSEAPFKADGAVGYFDDFPEVRMYFIFPVSAPVRFKIADKVHTLSLKDSLKAAISNFLPYSTGINNYGDVGVNQSHGLHFNVDPVDHDLTDALQAAYDVIAEVEGTKIVVGNGVKFDDTLSEGFSEREFMVGIIRSQQQGVSEIPGIGRKVKGEVRLTQQGTKKSRPDVLEYDECGNVISVIECQSGIKDGAALDNDHFARIISEYPYHPDFNGTVRKIVVIAGEYMPWHIKALENAPFEQVIILQTAIENGIVVLRPYAN